jgi:hypothetical protein
MPVRGMRAAEFQRLPAGNKLRVHVLISETAE